VRDAYYDGLPGDISSYLLSNAGFGWHAETAIHMLRLVLSGTLDRNPGLKLIIGHLGELLPMLRKRVEEIFGTRADAGRQRTVSQTILDQVWITTSGFFDMSAFLAALTAFNADRILFSSTIRTPRTAQARHFSAACRFLPQTGSASPTAMPTHSFVYRQLDQLHRAQCHRRAEVGERRWAFNRRSLSPAETQGAKRTPQTPRNKGPFGGLEGMPTGGLRLAVSCHRKLVAIREALMAHPAT
jgi:hypothetical protein